MKRKDKIKKLKERREGGNRSDREEEREECTIKERKKE
jgi:hypothetical protein